MIYSMSVNRVPQLVWNGMLGRGWELLSQFAQDSNLESVFRQDTFGAWLVALFLVLLAARGLSWLKPYFRPANSTQQESGRDTTSVVKVF
jgi:hypothetical protein